jgi:CheY-like chemotaxis protein
MLEELAYEYGVVVTAHAMPEPAFTTVNRTLLRQILITLTTEALARLRLTQVAFAVEANPEDDAVAIEIGLHGAAQARSTNENAMEDLLMLPAIQTLATALNSQIVKVGSRDGTAAIRILLPIQAETTVLVVDDNESLFALFRRYTVGHHYRLVHADTVIKALSCVQEERPDLITLDLMMPHQDGWELLRLLKSNPQTAAIPIIVCSVLVQPELAAKQGASAYLQKPIEQAELLKALSQAEALDRGELRPASPASNSGD